MNKHTLSMTWWAMACAATWVSTPVRSAVVELSDTVTHNFDIHTTVASKAHIAQQWPAAITVLDAASLVSTVAELNSAQAALESSTNELKRVEALQQADNNVALKVVEAARAQASADQSKRQSLQAQLLSEWGSAVSRMDHTALAGLTQRVLNDQVVLARAEVANSVSLSAPAIQLYTANGSAKLKGKLLGGMPQSQASVGRAYLLALEPGTADLQAGTVLSATLEDTSRTVVGVTVPRAAIVRWQGQTWVYVLTGDHQYERKAVTIQQWLEQAALISSGVREGERVVTTGAGLVLGAELSPPEADAE